MNDKKLKKDRKKILLILHLPPPYHGAAAVGAYIKESRIINEIFECKSINLSTSTTLTEISKGSFRKLLRYFSIIIQIIKQIIIFKPDICYLTLTAKGPGFFKDAILVILIKIFGKRIVCHFHNKGVSDCQDLVFHDILYRIIFKDTDVILLSHLLFSDIRKYVPLNRVFFCSNGIPFYHQRQDNKKYENRVPNLLFLSNLIVSKGLNTLLDACKMLHNNGIEFHCLIVGGEGNISQEELNNKITMANLNSVIIYLGKKEDEEKHRILASTDIFVHPTFNDCQPLVLLEAMQHSLPIISTFEGAIPDLVEDGITGFLVQKRDSQALADKLELLISNHELCKKMGEAGHKKFLECYTLDKFERNFSRVLEGLVNEEPAKNY